MNGITLQYVGQLLMPGEADDALIAGHRATFVCCLEDFSFATLCGEKLLVSGQMPPRGGRAPGSRLAAYFGDTVGFTRTADLKRPEALLADRSARALAAQRLRRFDEVVAVGLPYLRDWIVPEAEADFGAHPSVGEEDLPASEYVFAKAPQPYMIDRDLQDAIPKKAIHILSKVVESALRSKHLSIDVARSAVDEFVSRNILTHLMIDMWYDGTFRATQPGSMRFLPYVTRRLALRAASRPLARILMPHVLHDVLRDSTSYDPGSFAAVLLEKRNSPEYQKLRALFAELSGLDPATREQTEDVLQRAITDMIARARLSSRPLDRRPGDWRIDLAEYDHYHDALEHIAKPLEPFETLLGRVFPLLAPGLNSLAQSAGDQVNQIVFQVNPMSEYNNYGQVGAMGQGAHVDNLVQTQGKAQFDIDLKALAQQLADLQRVIIAKDADRDDQIAALDAIGEAKKAAASNDGKGAVSALSKAGAWVLGVATSIGAEVAAAALKSALGLPP